MKGCGEFGGSGIGREACENTGVDCMWFVFLCCYACCVCLFCLMVILLVVFVVSVQVLFLFF